MPVDTKPFGCLNSLKNRGQLSPPSIGESMFTTTLFIITVLDKVTGKVDHNIFTSLTKQDALRQFQTECLKPGTKFHQFPNDYSPICLGTFSDDET